jgi:hypothetical protein
MALVQIGLGDIAELGTQVAVHGSLRSMEMGVDDLFDLIVGIAILIYELAPGG